jgi:hypothetical protein
MECKYCKRSNGRTIKAYRFHDVFECDDCQCWTKQTIGSCCRDPFGVYVFKYGAYKAERIYIQCLNCYGCLNMTKPLPFKTYAEKVRGEGIFQIEGFNNWKEARKLESNEIYETEKHLRYIKTNDYLHKTHLQSRYWKNIRQKALERDSNICQSCKSAEATEVHHKTYKNLGKELLEELISYCRACHGKVHQKIN